MKYETERIFRASLITIAVAIIVALLCWSIGSGPDWIWKTILCATGLGLVFYTAYQLLD